MQDFEFIIVDDASGPRTEEILRSYKDERIRLFRNEDNEGLTRSLNKALEEARGKYIARMDADDISYPSRFQKQVLVLDSHPNYAVVGTQCEILDSRGGTHGVTEYCCSAEDVKKDVWRRSPFAHGTTMFVRQNIMNVGGYREIFRYAQDYDLWLRVLEKHDGVNVPDVLYGLRYHLKSVTLNKFFFQSSFSEMAREFARTRREKGADPLMQGDSERIQQRIESWQPRGAVESMRIRADSAIKLMEAMVHWGTLSDVFRLWLTALANNPFDSRVWKFLSSDPLRYRLKG
jgi:glycosyltransferase involved in cell wall biosynthesis